MDFTPKFSVPNKSAKLKKVYQNIKDTNSYWRTEKRTWQPLTDYQYSKDRHEVGDKVMVIYLDTGKEFEATIINIIEYDTAAKTLGDYNKSNTHMGAPLTVVLDLLKH